MLQENLTEFVRCNILRWYELGFTGKGVKVAVLDDGGVPSDWMRNYAKTEIATSSKGGHAISVTRVVHEVLPEAEIVMLPFINNFSSDVKQKSINWLIEHEKEIDIVCCSFHGDEQLIEQLRKTKLLIFCASGNQGWDDNIQTPASLDFTFAVGALEDYRDKVASYSNQGDGLTVMVYTDITVPINADASKTMKFNGTSCATPFMVGMMALFIQRLKELNIKPTRELIKKIIINNCIDYYDYGWDKISGYGLFRLPYDLPKGVIEMNTKDKDAFVDGEWVVLDVEPKIINSRTLVPLRFIAESLGCKVEYDKGQIKIIRGDLCV